MKKSLVFGFFSALLITFFCGWLLLIYFAGAEWNMVFNNPKKIPALGAIASLGALPNLALFFWFLHKNNEEKARGVLGFVLVLAVCILIIKFL